MLPFRYEHRRLDIRTECVAAQDSRGEALIWDGVSLMIDEVFRTMDGDDADGTLDSDFRPVLIDELVRTAELVQHDSAHVGRVFPVAEASDFLAFCFLGGECFECVPYLLIDGLFHLAGEHFYLAPAVFVAVFYADSLDFGVVILEIVLVDGFAVFVDDGLAEVPDDVVVEPVAFVPGSFDETALPQGELAPVDFQLADDRVAVLAAGSCGFYLFGSFRIAGFLLLGAVLAGEPRFIRFLRGVHLCGSPRLLFSVRVDISISYYIRFICACQAITRFSLFYLIFSFYYFLFASSCSFNYVNCVLVITIHYRKVKRCRAIIPRLKPWDFPHGIFNR